MIPLIHQSNSWENNLVEIFFKRELLYKTAAPYDYSLLFIEDLEKKGYSEVTWQAPNAQCFTCQDLHKQQWPINEFIYFTKYDAALWSKSHPGCYCFIIVTGADPLTNEELPKAILDASGILSYAG